MEFQCTRPRGATATGARSREPWVFRCQGERSARGSSPWQRRRLKRPIRRGASAPELDRLRCPWQQRGRRRRRRRPLLKNLNLLNNPSQASPRPRRPGPARGDRRRRGTDHLSRDLLRRPLPSSSSSSKLSLRLPTCRRRRLCHKSSSSSSAASPPARSAALLSRRRTRRRHLRTCRRVLRRRCRMTGDLREGQERKRERVCNSK